MEGEAGVNTEVRDALRDEIVLVCGTCTSDSAYREHDYLAACCEGTGPGIPRTGLII